MEALGDSIVPREAPHGGDFCRPASECPAELYELGQTGLAELVQRLEKSLDEGNALLSRAVFLQQQVAQTLFETIDFGQDGELLKVGLQLGALLGLEIVAMTPHERKQAAMLGAGGVNLPPAGQEMVVDQANDVEAIGHDLGLGKMFAHQRTIDARQVHTDDADAIFAWQFCQVV